MVVREYMASCPMCKTLETLQFLRDMIIPTKKFHQGHDGIVYHDCNGYQPCRAFLFYLEGGRDKRSNKGAKGRAVTAF